MENYNNILKDFLTEEFGKHNFKNIYKDGLSLKVIGYRINNCKSHNVCFQLNGCRYDGKYDIYILFEGNDKYRLKLSEVCGLHNCCECTYFCSEKCKSNCLYDLNELSFFKLMNKLVKPLNYFEAMNNLSLKFKQQENEILKNNVKTQPEFEILEKQIQNEKEKYNELLHNYHNINESKEYYKSLYENSQSQIETLKSIINKM